MASPLLTCSLRASACHTYVSSTSASSSIIRCFASTPSATAVAKKAPPPEKKRQTPVKKAPHAGPRGTKKRAGGDTTMNFAALTTPFCKPPQDMSQLITLSPEEANASTLNKVMAFDQQQMEIFRTFGIENKLQSALNSHIRPCSLVRQATLDLYSSLEESRSSPKKFALTGPLSGGKSYLLLQAVSYALASDWLVIYLPRLLTFINSSSSFEHSVEEQAWLQPDALQKFFKVMLDVNEAVLKKIKLNDGKGAAEIVLDRQNPIPASSNLQQLLQLAMRQRLTALASQQMFDLFLSSIQSQSSVPVLMAIDHLQALYLPSRYRTPDYAFIQSYELGPIRSLIQLVAGKKNLQSGMILGAFSQHNTTYPVPKEVKAVINQQLAPVFEEKAFYASTRSPLDMVELSPYDNIHPMHLKHVKASSWSLFDVPDTWSEAELKALYDIRRRQGRNWNGGNVPLAEQFSDLNPFAAQAAGSQVTAATQSEDELFFLRVVESGRNPEKFEKSLWGSSAL